jgi:histidinol-phosphate aminotransferase
MSRMAIRPDVEALPAYRFQALEAAVKLDQNESPWDLPEPLRSRALARVARAELHRYPAMHADGVAARIAEFEGWPVEGVVVANGSNVLIQALVIAAGLGRRVLSVAPSFSLYALQARLMGAELREVPLGAAFELPLEGLLRELAEGHGVHFLAAPMAPTGNAVSEGDVWTLARAGASAWLTVIDEAYGPFAGSDFSAVVRDVPGAVSLRTCSKAFGMGGVRLGYALADPDLAVHLRKAVLPFTVSALQSALVETVLEDPTYVRARVERIVAERDRVGAALQALPGIEVFPSVTNFVLVRVADAAAVHAGLLERGIVVRRQDHLPGLRGCLRVSVGTTEENDALVAALTALAAPPAQPADRAAAPTTTEESHA